MTTTFFKHRGRFDFSPHRFEIGNLIVQNQSLEDNLFLLKLYKLEEREYPAYYQFHLEYFLKEHVGEEKAFFSNVREIIVNRIRHFKRLDPFGGKYASGLAHTRILEIFLNYLKSIDQWNNHKLIESVIVEKDELILHLKEKIRQQEILIKEYTKYEAGEKIVISKGNLPAFIDLVQQLQELTLPNDHRLLRSQAQSPWYKMIARYFMHGDKEISIDTARNYFPAQKEDKPAKFIRIAEKDKRFLIVAVKQEKP
jgi:hypothetical protein